MTTIYYLKFFFHHELLHLKHPLTGMRDNTKFTYVALQPLCVCVCVCVHVQSLESYPALCDPMDCSPPGSSVHGILQARILEWVAILTSRGLPGPEIEPISLASLALNWKVLSRGGT